MNKAIEVTVSDRQRTILEKWIRNKAGTPQRLFVRCQIILMCADRSSNHEVKRRLGVDRQRARRWRKRWAENEERLAAAELEKVNDKDLAKMLADILADAPRPGAKSKFTAEQFTQIIALACELPEDNRRPVTHWTPPELADEAAKRGIVKSISPRHVDRLLKGGISARTRASTG